MPRKAKMKKSPEAGRAPRKGARQPSRKNPRGRPGFDRRVEDFAEEVGRIGEGGPRAVRTRRLYRSGREKILGGVCGGIGEYLGVDPVIVRLLWVVFSLLWGAGIILYIIAWIIMPRNPRHRW